MASSLDHDPMERFRRLVPEMGGNYKGSHGKVAVVGGCLEFTGAPFFAAMSALRVGADMAYVICTPSAATAIKSYSPELMVLPYLPETTQQQYDSAAAPDEAAVERAVARIAPWLARASAVVVGPGLGDDPAVCATASALIARCRQLGLPLVVDGSALTHIVAKVGGWVAGGPAAEAAPFGGPVVLAKGAADLVCTPDQPPHQPPHQPSSSDRQPHQPTAAPAARYVCDDLGSPRRCGGQGDVLAGTAAAFLCWAAKHHHQQQDASSTAAADGISSDEVAVCALAACKVVRKAAGAAFEVEQRGMVAGDIVPHLSRSLVQVAS
ncbi:ATP-dependent (S)-NAD(P)H-hydrate dehydratase [Tetrabaena socialis]|uniref:ATP-dependent (S)-NAD(P)H-hydrate dehydratase n=1 Tax=Tetrabaena socialis TaxID=47790 RepID=A0A2J7ZXR6_9CHLO|nr:ATP-dependent (S)-NAD(P)H-hydrate dehydratase [Tetrabaena socialis]|eukprot:PNH05060.1 ATP-dependent (S)-NAD(P)H-hydrate dehydratase [Tetrabaena socialis]